MKYSNKTVAVLLLIIMCTVVIDTSWQFYLEKSAREQAQYNLKQVQVCTNDLLDGVDVDNASLEKALKTCAREMRVSPTGDMFAFDINTKVFIFDPSLDCFVEGGKLMTVESECSLHKDKEICKTVLNTIASGRNSEGKIGAWWQFNDGREYLEWIILPSEDIGYDGKVRGGNEKPQQVVLVQGIQEDELLARYSTFRWMLYIIGFVSIIVNLLLSVHENMLEIRNDSKSR